MSPIFALNDDCLEHVLQKLGLQDQLRFARTCPRFRRIYKRASARLHKSINSDELEKCTIREIGTFFKLSGAHVEAIKVMHMRERLAKLVGRKCSNLRRLHFVFCPNMHLFMRSIIDNAYHLEALEICSSGIRDEDISALRNLNNLRVLELSNCYITGRTFHELPASIEVLKLNCLNLEVDCLPRTCKRLTKLRSLDLLRLYRYDEVFKTMVTENACPSLEVLRFTMALSGTSEYVAQLPGLKQLTICTDLLDTQERQLYNRLLTILVDRLVEYKDQELEHLTIGARLTEEQIKQVGRLGSLRVLCLSWVDFDYTPIARLKLLEKIVFNEPCFNDSMLLLLFDACPKLHYLGLKQTCLNEKLIYGIADRVRQEMISDNIKRKLPIELEFCTSDKEIRMFVCNNPEAAPKNVIKLKGYNDFSFWAGWIC
ncbi:uncharacterized protein LOC108036431 [Drosophila biarmipes]|uniref:uncharacterized protein LOC108036431 n=1 Tax=Drosophila biarmipes TaxID=125945 RepID=UPI0021CC72FF|nr:uncharacterized protein LOC108036431 [Drosophila biarmipes]